MSPASVVELCLVEKLSVTPDPLVFLMESFSRARKAVASSQAQPGSPTAVVRDMICNYSAIYMEHGNIFGHQGATPHA